MERKALEDAEQVRLEAQHLEKILRSAYDTLFGYLQSVSDVYARANLVRHLDILYQQSLASVADSPDLAAETVDLKTTSQAEPGAASTASSDSPSGGSTGKPLRENSW